MKNIAQVRLILVLALFGCFVSTGFSQQQQDFRLLPFPFEEAGINSPVDIMLDGNGYLWLLEENKIHCLLSDGFVQITETSGSKFLEFAGYTEEGISISTIAGDQTIKTSTAISSMHMAFPISTIGEPVEISGGIKIRIDDKVGLTWYDGNIERSQALKCEVNGMQFELETNEQSRLLLDPANGIWILGTNGLMLVCNSNTFMRIFDTPVDVGLVTQVVIDTLLDRTYVLTNRSGIIVLRTSTKTIEAHLTETTNGQPVHGYNWRTIDGQHFIQSNEALLKFDPNNLSIDLVLDPQNINGQHNYSQYFNQMTVDIPRKRLLIPTKNNSIIIYNTETKLTKIVQTLPTNPYLKNLVYEVQLFDQNTALVLTEHGFFHLDLLNLSITPAHNKWPNLNFGSDLNLSSIQIIDEKIVFISSFGEGFYRYDIDTDSLYRPQGRIRDDVMISDMYWDGLDHVYCMADQGMIVYQISSNSTQSIGVEQGLPDPSLYYKSMHRTAPGLMYQGLDEKYAMLTSSELIRTNDIDPFIEQIEVNGNTTELGYHRIGGHLELGHLERNVAIRLGTPIYSFQPNEGKYVRLSDKNSAAIYYGIGETIRFNYLPWGQNNIEISESAEGPFIPLLHINIAPPFWRTWWFILLISGTVATVILVLFRMRVKHVEQRAALKSEYDLRIAQLELSSLRSQMHPHFIFNSLNSIKSFIAKNEPREATRYLNKFAKLIRSILNNSQQTKVDLKSELEALELYLELEQIRFDNSFQFSINVAPEIDQDEVTIPPLIFQPFSENAIWHGLMNKEGDRDLDITISRTKDLLKATIRDNGIGRAAAQKLKSKTATKHKSLGMKITAEIIERTHQNGGSGIVINDLMDANGAACGTEVIITLPISTTP